MGTLKNSDIHLAWKVDMYGDVYAESHPISWEKLPSVQRALDDNQVYTDIFEARALDNELIIYSKDKFTNVDRELKISSISHFAYVITWNGEIKAEIDS